MNFKLNYVFLFFYITNYIFSAEQQTEFSILDLKYVRSLEINKLTPIQKTNLYQYLYLQLEALSFLQQKQLLIDQLSFESDLSCWNRLNCFSTYKKHCAKVKECEHKYFQLKNIATKLYYSLDKKTKRKIDFIMINCMQLGKNNLCKTKLEFFLKYIKES